MISFKKVFKSQETPDDGLNQTQREAIVDLLNYCSFVDHSITISENDLVDGLEYQLHWDANTDFDYYENKSVGLVRGVLDNQDAANGFLKGVRAKLDSEKSREIAMGLVDKLIKTDGKVTPEESQAYAAISGLLR